MKANTPELMKFKRLQRKLGESRRGTIGLLESMWIEVSRNCPEGDIGKFSNEEIAIMVDWEGEPDQLVSALIECRWLDKCEQHRLVVHDWADHCPTYVRGGLAKRGKVIAIATSSEVEPIATSSDCSACTSEVPSTKPIQAKPSLTKPSESQVEAKTPSRSFEADRCFVPKKFSDHAPFVEAWNRWKRHRVEKQKPLGAIEEEAQLADLDRFSPDEAIEIVSFSIRRGAMNLITSGDHRAKPPPDNTGASGGNNKKQRLLNALKGQGAK